MVLRRGASFWSSLRSSIRVRGLSGAAGHALRRAASPIVRLRPGRGDMASAPDALYAFYDLDRQPSSFDTVHFLLAAEAAREKVGSPPLVLVVVPRSEREARVVERFRALRGSTWGAAGEDWMRSQVVAAVAHLLPSVSGVVEAPGRAWAGILRSSLDAARVYPPRYDVRVPQAQHHLRRLSEALDGGFDARRLRSSPVARDAVARWTGGGPFVTVTLRRSSTSPIRNSSPQAWQAFVRRAVGDGFDVVLVDDFEAPPLDWSCVDGQSVRVFEPAVWNVQARMALYESAAGNWFVNNGPAALALFARERPPTFVTKMLVPDVPETSEAYFDAAGIRVGGPYPSDHPFGAFVWSDDDEKTLRQTWQRFLDRD